MCSNPPRSGHAAWKEAGHTREPRVSVSRSIFALVDDRDRAYFGGGVDGEDQIGFIDANTRAIFGRSYAAEPDALIEQLKKDEAIAEADTLLRCAPPSYMKVICFSPGIQPVSTRSTWNPASSSTTRAMRCPGTEVADWPAGASCPTRPPALQGG
jgi:hypothetical protein